MKNLIFYILFFLIFASCLKKVRVYPKIIPSAFDTIIYNNYDSIQIAKNIIYRINFNGDSINLNNNRFFLGDDDSYAFNNNLEERKTDSIKIYVDVKNEGFHTNFIHTFFDFPMPPPPKGIEIDSLELAESQKEYQKQYTKHLKIHYKANPFYIYNYSKNPQEILKPIAGGDLFIIIEAKDKKGIWKPIEYFEQFSFLCGTGHQNYLLKPKSYILGAIKKYDGNFETQMRIKLKSFEKNFYSNEFKGKMNYSQFDTKNAINKLKNRFSYRGNEYIDYVSRNMFLN